MKKIGILGGTFDPVHCGHMIMARAAMEQYGLDRVLIMTGGMPPHKSDDNITAAQIRHKMVELAASGEKGLVPFDYELSKATPTYTAETMTELKELNPDTEYYFIIGEDSLRMLLKWYRPDIIVSKCILLVYPRGGGGLAELVRQRSEELHADIRMITSPEWGISSTDIRERVRQRKSIRYFVPDKVYEYITDNNIYR